MDDEELSWLSDIKAAMRQYLRENGYPPNALLVDAEYPFSNMMEIGGMKIIKVTGLRDIKAIRM